MSNVRWNISVLQELDQSVRIFLTAQANDLKGNLSRLTEEAVRAYLLERSFDQAKGPAIGMSEDEINDLIDEAVQWAREH